MILVTLFKYCKHYFKGRTFKKCLWLHRQRFLNTLNSIYEVAIGINIYTRKMSKYEITFTSTSAVFLCWNIIYEVTIIIVINRPPWLIIVNDPNIVTNTIAQIILYDAYIVSVLWYTWLLNSWISYNIGVDTHSFVVLPNLYIFKNISDKTYLIWITLEQEKSQNRLFLKIMVIQKLKMAAYWPNYWENWTECPICKWGGKTFTMLPL